jgi:putative transport protein
VENSNKKSLKWLWIAIAIVVVAAIGVWCGISASNANGLSSTFKFSTTFVMFTLMFLILALGYLLGGVSIKGVSLGTAGVFLVAILLGWLCTLNFKDVPLLGSFYMSGTEETVVKYLKGPIQNIGLVMFVGSVGFIAGPNFFKNLAKNFKTYIVLGIVIILSGTLVAVLCTILTDYGPEYWAGVLSGALTSTPGFSAAKDAATENLARITLGHAIAYPFGVVGVVLFVQLLPKFLKSDMQKERDYLKLDAQEEVRDYSKYFKCEDFGFLPFALAIVAGLLLGSINIPLTGAGYAGPSFSLGTTGGVLIMCLVFGHFGHLGKLSLEVNEKTLKVMRELGLALFLLGAGFEGGVALVQEVSKPDAGIGMVLWGLFGGAVMTIVPMVVGFFLGKYVLKLPLLNNLGSITGGMTSTPALGTLISTAKTDDVASAYASTYPIALILIVLASQLLITLL